MTTQIGNGPSCPDLPTSAAVRFTVVDVSPTTVTLTWWWPGTAPSPAPVFHEFHEHEATIGPVPDDLDDALPAGDHPLAVTVTAVDANGNRATRTAEVGTLRACQVIG
jgi:hypothetical protein